MDWAVSMLWVEKGESSVLHLGSALRPGTPRDNALWTHTSTGQCEVTAV